VAVTASQPTSSFAAGFAAGAGSAFVVSFMKAPRRGAPGSDEPPAGEP
jgi:hypothetical protein